MPWEEFTGNTPTGWQTAARACISRFLSDFAVVAGSPRVASNDLA